MRKLSNTYYFSVEGKTEQWYLKWLGRTINNCPKVAKYAKIDCRVQKNPVSRVKTMKVLSQTEITHIFDRESEDQEHEKKFENTLMRMKEAQKKKKDIRYKLGYSNFSFELWILLHKTDCCKTLNHRGQYFSLINRTFGENFSSMDEYKEEKNFNRILDTFTLDDVWSAIRRSERIMKNNKDKGYTAHQYLGYEYYTVNPSLSVWEVVKKILTECLNP
ncbi:MAG: RloB family protein [Sphaerochaetaceae bacterium]|nr:RloB family protein [Sphaerochaetaceae bacterium]